MKEQSYMKLHSFFESLRELRTFLLLFTTQALSSLGSAMTSYALVIWAYQQSGSALSTALLTVSSYAPYVVFSLFCGALVDRLDTRRTMLVSDALAACTTVAALVLLQTGRLQITHLYLLNVLNGLMNTLQQPASEAATTALLPKSQYQRVGGLRYLSSSLSGLLTPVLAMALMTLGGLRAVIFADLATFAVAFTALLCFIRIPKRQTGSPHESFLDSTRQGLRFFRQAPGLLTLVLYLAAINLVSSMYEAALPSLLLSRSWGGETVMGIFSTVTALATLIGSLLAVLLPAPKSRVRVVCGCLLVSMGTENFLLAFGQNLPTWCVGAALGWLLIPVMSAPNSLYQLLAHCRAGWARPTSMGSIRLFMLVFYIAGKTAFASLIIPSSLSLPAPPPRPLKSPARFARIPIPLRGAGCKPFSVSADEKRPPARLQTVWKNGITPRLPQ